MRKLLELYWWIACFRKGPEDVPASPFLAQLTALVYVLVQLPLVFTAQGNGIRVIVNSIGDLVILVVFTWLLLKIRSKPERFLQTATALLGTGVIISIIAVPLGILALNAAGTEAAFAPSMGLLIIIIWSVGIAAHIFSRAMSRPMIEGIAISLVYFIINYQLITALSPVTAGG